MINIADITYIITNRRSIAYINVLFEKGILLCLMILPNFFLNFRIINPFLINHQAVKVTNPN